MDDPPSLSLSLSLPSIQEAVKRKAAREKRFGLEGEAAKDLESSIERREARAKRFGTKLVATDDGEPIKLVDRYKYLRLA